MKRRVMFVMIALLIGGSVSLAQEPAELRELADQKKREADSLLGVWDVMWKQSDSLRIESMLVRISSNRLRREANSLNRKADEREQQILAEQHAIERKLEEERREAAFIGPRQPAPSPQPDPASMSPVVAHDSVQTASVEDVEILEEMKHTEHLRAQRRKATSGNVRSGQTLSDEGTAMVLRAQPDTGVASYYGKKFHGRKTASGETFSMYAHTCAHRWLPFGTKLKVTNLTNGKSVVVRVNDRGPFHHGRMIDVSKQAAIDIDMIRSGTAEVSVEVVD